MDRPILFTRQAMARRLISTSINVSAYFVGTLSVEKWGEVPILLTPKWTFALVALILASMLTSKNGGK